MNCLYITLFFNIVAGIVQTFIKSWNQLLCPRVIEVCRLSFEPRHDSSSSSSNFFTARFFFRWRNKWKSLGYHKQQQFVREYPLDVQLLRWEIVWRNAPRIWRDFGSALPFQTRLTQTKPVLPLWNKHGWQVRDQGRRQCCHNKHKNFLIGLHVMYLYFPDTPRNCTEHSTGTLFPTFLSFLTGFSKIGIWGPVLTGPYFLYIFLFCWPRFLVNDQRDVQFFSMYLFIFLTLYMFRAHRAHHQERKIVSIQTLVAVTLCRWLCRVQVGNELPTCTRHCHRQLPEVVLTQFVYPDD